MTLVSPPSQIEITWEGPFAWPEFEGESSLPALPRMPGVYIQAFEHQDGYLVAGAGITKRPVAMRLREHTRRFLNGEYTVLDTGAASRAERKEVWHGWGYARAHRHEFEARREAIQDAARRQLASYRIFVADPEIAVAGMRLRDRLEAGIMDSLYQQPPPICDFPDRGMFLARRRAEEPPVLIRSVCSSVLYGLSEVLLV
jgi:hypothetical protein